MDIKKPKISFCVLFYNQEKFVEDTLDSMFNQSYENYEIIIRDDFSNDNTKEEIKKYLKKNNVNINVKVEYGEKNLGIVKSLNRVLAMSHGDFIALQGGDDISLPSRLKESIELILENNADLISVDAKVIDINNRVIFDSFYCRNDNGLEILYSDEIKKGNIIKINKNVYMLKGTDKSVSSCLGGFGLLFNRKILNYYNNFLPDTMYYEDRFITFLARMNKGCLQYTKQLVLYRRTNNNMSMPMSVKKIDIYNNMIKIKKMENSVCLEQLNYLKNGGHVNHIYNRNNMIDYLSLEYYRNLFIIKSVNSYCVKESKLYLLKKIKQNPNTKAQSIFKNLVGFFIPYLYKRKITKEYYNRLSFFGN